MKVWLVKCLECYDHYCIVLFDHKPTESELKKAFCMGVLDQLEICEFELKEIFGEPLHTLVCKK